MSAIAYGYLFDFVVHYLKYAILRLMKRDGLTMSQRKTVKAARLAARVEPDLRCAIELEARRRQMKVGRVVRAMLRDQLAILMLANERSVSA